MKQLFIIPAALLLAGCREEIPAPQKYDSQPRLVGAVDLSPTGAAVYVYEFCWRGTLHEYFANGNGSWGKERLDPNTGKPVPCKLRVPGAVIGETPVEGNVTPVKGK
jgi:hypothetical protein